MAILVAIRERSALDRAFKSGPVVTPNPLGGVAAEAS